MKISIVISFSIIIFSCNDKNTKSVGKYDLVKDTLKINSGNKIEIDNIKVDESQNEVMFEEDILFNGKLKRYFTLNEFHNVFGKADSIKLMSEVDPCNYIFENEDGSKDMNDKYLYKNGSIFENTKQKVAVNEFRFTKDNFVMFKRVKLNSSTTIIELQKLFPNAINKIETMNVNDGVTLQKIKLREDGYNNSDGHIEIIIKNEKLYLLRWWFPC